MFAAVAFAERLALVAATVLLTCRTTGPRLTEEPVADDALERVSSRQNPWAKLS